MSALSSQFVFVCCLLMTAAAKDCARGDPKCRAEGDSSTMLQSRVVFESADESADESKKYDYGDGDGGGFPCEAACAGMPDSGQDACMECIDSMGGGPPGEDGAPGGNQDPHAQCTPEMTIALKNCVNCKQCPNCECTGLYAVTDCDIVSKDCHDIIDCLTSTDTWACSQQCADCMAEVEPTCDPAIDPSSPSSCSHRVRNGQSGALLDLNRSNVKTVEEVDGRATEADGRATELDDALVGKRSC